jgi:RNA-directed DNA polymerase
MQESGDVRFSMNDEPTRPAGVTGATQAKQAGNIRERWWWIEHSVWTERMLTRLETSEPATVWFGLWDKVISERNLQAAYWAVWRKGGAAGVDGQTVPQFEAQQAEQMARLREELQTKRYHRKPARRVWIPKPGTTEQRPLGIPTMSSFCT